MPRPGVNSACDQGQGGSQNRFQPVPPQGRSNCSYCGGSQHPRDQCPASGKTCIRCEKKGYFAKLCRAAMPAANSEANPRIKLKPAASTTVLEANTTALRAFTLAGMSVPTPQFGSRLLHATQFTRSVTTVFSSFETNKMEIDILNVEILDFSNYLKKLPKIRVGLSN